MVVVTKEMMAASLVEYRARHPTWKVSLIQDSIYKVKMDLGKEIIVRPGDMFPEE